MERREKEKSFDLIRALCTVGIVLFHYSYIYIEYGILGNHLQFSRYRNGDWGGLFVAIFFMLSGAVLWYNYSDKIKLPMFYLKRFLSIFPMFYLAWVIAYFAKVRELGTYLWGGPKKNLIYTILGIDGYFLNPGVNMNYYCLGEWFLGAILILYVLYPFVRMAFQTMIGKIIYTVLLAVAYTANLYFDWFTMSDGKNILTCLMDFTIGMWIVTYRKQLKNKWCLWGSILLSCVLMFSDIPVKEVMCSTLVGMLWFVILLNLSDFLMKGRMMQILVKWIGNSSFGIFLVHHVILYAYMKQYQGTEIGMGKSLGLFFLLFLIIFIVGALLAKWGKIVTKGVFWMLSKIPKKEEEKKASAL